MAFTCADYRQEMMLVALKKQLTKDSLTSEENAAISIRIRELEAAMGLD